MMSNWRSFEEQATQYLSDHFGDIATFTHVGESNSKKPDICVNNDYYIEAKSCPAQCGQFVLFPNPANKKFAYSKLNASKPNDFTLEIINHMNKNFDIFSNAGTKGVDITFTGDQYIFSQWIIAYYLQKNVRFFITNNFKIYTISDIDKAFSIKAKFRIKRSGSSDVGYDNADRIIAYINEYMSSINSISKSGKKLFVTATNNLDKKRINVLGDDYMFSKRDQQYEIRKLSSTQNANVIFSINLKPNTCDLSVVNFKCML